MSSSHEFHFSLLYHSEREIRITMIAQVVYIIETIKAIVNSSYSSYIQYYPLAIGKVLVRFLFLLILLQITVL